ncbi:hypothetical protein D3C72_1829860 [compost metagenome]
MVRIWSILSELSALNRLSAAPSVESRRPDRPDTESDRALTLCRNLSMPSAFSASDLEKVSAFLTVLVSGSRASVMKPCSWPIASSARFRILSAVARRLVTLD